VNALIVSGIIAATAAVVLALLTAIGTRATIAQGSAQRLDARAPTVLVDLEVAWPPLQPSVIQDGSPQPLIGRAAAFRMPAQATDPVLLVVHARVSNVGSTPAQVRLGEGGRFLDLDPGDPDALRRPPLGTDAAAIRSRRLIVGASVQAVFIDQRTVNDWVRHALSTSEGVLAETTVEVVATDAFDAGVTDTILVTLAARPLRRDDQDDGRWLLRSPHLTEGLRGIIEATASPIRRTYWSSRQRGRRLRGARS